MHVAQGPGDRLLIVLNTEMPQKVLEVVGIKSYKLRLPILAGQEKGTGQLSVSPRGRRFHRVKDERSPFFARKRARVRVS